LASSYTPYIGKQKRLSYLEKRLWFQDLLHGMETQTQSIPTVKYLTLPFPGWII